VTRTPRTLITLLTAASVLFGLAAPAFPAGAAPGRRIVHLATPSAERPRADFDRSTVLVRFRSGASTKTRDGVLAANGMRLSTAVGRTGFSVVSTGTRTPKAALRALKGDPSVAEVQLNYLRHASKTPNDQFYADYQKKYLGTAKFPSAWDKTTGSTSKNIAIVDTGVDTGHPDLSGSRMKAGYDFVNDDTNPSDDNGHGTMVAGIAAAVTNNSTGVAGAGWNAGIIPVKVLDADGNGTDADVAAGITWAADHGASVINLSLGGYGTSPVLADAVAYAVSKDIVVVAAAGNEATNLPSYPASYDDVLSVAATDPSGNFAFFSDWGWTIDLSAPGMGITSTFPRSLTPPGYLAYATGDGTSFSSPLVAGAALLVRVKNPSWAQSKVADQLRTTAHDKGPRGIDRFYGWGVLDANAALGGSKQSPATQPAQDTKDPNGFPDKATDVTSSTTTPTISPEGDIDWFKHTVSATGSITWTVTPPAADPQGDRAYEMDPVLEVYGPDYTLLGTIDASSYGTKETITVPAAVTGTYFLQVTNYNGSRSSTTYKVSVSTSTTSLAPVTGPTVWVRKTSPTDFKTTVTRTIVPYLTFGRDLDPTSITPDTVYLKNGVRWGNPPVTLIYDPATRKLTLDRTGTFDKNAPFVVIVDGVRDTDGNVMPTYSFQFVTEST
jgi:serine protease